MRYLFLVIALTVLNNAFSQNIIEILEDAISSGASTAHSEMKSLELDLTYVQDRDEMLVLIYNENDISNTFNSGAIILKNDFNTVYAISFVSSTKELTELVMKHIKADSYTFKKFKDDGEIVYSNGIYDLGLKTESSSSGNEYRVSISRVNIY